MPLVFRKLQNTPLSNNQLDGNFEYLRDQLTLKVDISALTAAYVAGKLNAPALIGNGVYQTAYQLSQTNALNAWTVRGIEPSVSTPSGATKTSLVVRGESDGSVSAPIFVGALNGNADTATNSDYADVAYSLDSSYTVPISLGGTNATTAADARENLKVLSVESDNQMTSRLNLNPASATASIAFGVGATPDTANNGDMWTTTTGFHYKIAGASKTIAPIESPTFTGAPKAPAHPDTGGSSQLATISHIAATETTLNNAIALKANIASPQFTGIPTCDSTPDKSINNTRIATTGHVHAVVSDSASALTTAYEQYATNAVAALSSSVNTLLSAKASLASPVLTGTPRSTTPAADDDSDRIATTAYTVDAIAALETTINGVLSGINDLINQTRPVPTASVFYLATSTVPNGYLEANGSAVSRTTYAALWQALGSPNTGNGSTTFNLPDLRGEFIRGWDHGRGFDSGRVLGSAQASQNLEHNHGLPGDDQLGYANGYGGWTYSTRGAFPYDARSSYGGGGQIWNTTTDGGSESRPHNIALMPIIKW